MAGVAPAPSRWRRARPTNCRWRRGCWTACPTCRAGGRRPRPCLQHLPRPDLGTRRPTGHPAQAHRRAGRLPALVYAKRHLVENLWARLTEGRAIATRYEKTAKFFLGVLSFAATFDWLRG